MDEQWFYLVDAVIESRSGDILRKIYQAYYLNPPDAFSDILHQISEQIDRLKDALNQMTDHCHPWIFYHLIRKYIAGWGEEGMLYGNEEVPRKYVGSSAAQSPLIQAIDVCFGIHYDKSDPMVGIIMESRKYMMNKHVLFLEWLEKEVDLRKRAQELGSDAKMAYNRCLDSLAAFRRDHIIIVSRFILSVDKGINDEEKKGTGGSPIVQFLKFVRQNMDQYKFKEIN